MSDNIVHAKDYNYSRLLWWEVRNFMSIEYGKCEFDTQGKVNIINLKGYNDAGKSTMIRAVDVGLQNRYQMQHADFIQDDKSFFDLRFLFSDNVLIRRIKYTTGQGVYEMYKDNTLVFTTVKNGVMTPITKVPDIISDYLGLIKYDNIYLNSRSCTDKQLLVETTGSENYKALNSILYSEELYLASSLLNTHMNEVMAKKTTLEVRVQDKRNTLNKFPDLSIELVEYLENLDIEVDAYAKREADIQNLLEINNSLSELVISPEIEKVDTDRVELLLNLVSILSEGDIVIPPLVDTIDTSRVDLLLSLLNIDSELSSISDICMVTPIDSSLIDRLSDLGVLLNYMSSYSSIEITPSVEHINTEKVDDLISLANTFLSVLDYESKLESLDTKLSENKRYISELQSKAESSGVKTVICSNCGNIELVES